MQSNSMRARPIPGRTREDKDSGRIAKQCWITWNNSARSRNLAHYLGIDIHIFTYTGSAFLKHTIGPVWTVYTLLKADPDIVFIQYSFMLLNTLAVYRLLKRKRIVVVCDCHSKALRRSLQGPLRSLFRFIKRRSFRCVDISLIHNRGMVRDIRLLHPDYLILHDVIPETGAAVFAESAEKYCVYISSFAVDEPFDEIFKVASLNSGITFYWTGRIPAGRTFPTDIPGNLSFTGYLDSAAYYRLITRAGCILSLTKEQDCLQCGAFEALSVNVPMVVSDTDVLRECFHDAAVYTGHDPAQISAAIRYALENAEHLKAEMKKIRKVLTDRFDRIIPELRDRIHALHCGHSL